MEALRLAYTSDCDCENDDDNDDDEEQYRMVGGDGTSAWVYDALDKSTPSTGWNSTLPQEGEREEGMFACLLYIPGTIQSLLYPVTCQMVYS